MKRRTFLWILSVVIGICLLATVAHLIYTMYAYQHCSVIYFIAKELW